MKKILIFIALFLCLNIGYARAEAMNGAGWNMLNYDKKVSYLKGFYEGLATYETFVLPNLPKTLQESVIPQMFPIKLNYEQIMQSLDRFYYNYKNINIPIGLALMVIQKELSGADKSTIKDIQEGLRGVTNKQGSK